MARIIRTADSKGPSLGDHRRAVETGGMDVLTAEMIALAEMEATRIVTASRQEAQSILTAAEQEAQSILAAAEQEAEAIKQRAGRERQDAINREVESLRDLVSSLSYEIEEHKKQLRTVGQAESVDVAVAIAERIVRKHIEENGELARVATRETLKWVTSAAKVFVHVSANDFERHQQVISGMLEELHPHADCEIIEDTSISDGGVRVETEFGTIDQTVEKQLNCIAEELRDQLQPVAQEGDDE